MKKTDRTPLPDKNKFLIKNLLRGLLWLSVIVLGYLYLRKNYGFGLESVLGSLYDDTLVVYLIFLCSEIIFGLIPPEFFMIWSLRSGDVGIYISNVFSLSLISYVAGIIGYGIGARFKNTLFYQEMEKRIFGKFKTHLNQYGGFLVVVAALTPLPFSGIAMLIGAIHYSFKKYLWYSLFRFVRFLVYSIVILEANFI